MKKQVGVIFGSRSCEREVAIISAVQLMRHVNREKYEVVPVYIDEFGNWYTGEPLKDKESFRVGRRCGQQGQAPGQQGKRGSSPRWG